MKKIIILSHALELGGAEKSLIGLLSALKPNLCSIDLFLLRHEGPLMDQIPEWVNVLPQVPEYTVLARPLKDTIREGHLILSLARLYGKWKASRYDRHHGYTDSGVSLEYSHKYTYSHMPEIQPDTEYDLAISFLTPHYMVANKVRAKKKIAWIHTDYSHVQIDQKSELLMWSAYDRIMSISEDVTTGFVNLFPELEDRIVLMENILPDQLIQLQAAEEAGDDLLPVSEANSIRLLSIGRFCEAKNFDRVPSICAGLRQMGLPVTWYLIGFGGDEALIRKNIHDYAMEDHVRILGAKENPYPYVKACDVYVQPSRYEGKCVAVREAQLLGKPVIITRYATSSSQLEDGVDGIIVAMEEEACIKEMADVLSDTDRLAQLEKNCHTRDYSNKKEAMKLMNLV